MWLLDWIHVCAVQYVYTSTLVQTLARQEEADVARRRKGEQTVSETEDCVGCLDIPLFSMAWIRLTRTGGTVSGGVSCSLGPGTETAETTTQITATLLAQSLTKISSADKGTVNYAQLEIMYNIMSRTIKLEQVEVGIHLAEITGGFVVLCCNVLQNIKRLGKLVCDAVVVWTVVWWDTRYYNQNNLTNVQ